MLPLAHSLGTITSAIVSKLYAVFIGSVPTEPTPTEPTSKNNVVGGKEKFPNDAIFTRLLQMSTERPGLLFHDDYGIDANYDDLIRDVIHVRRLLQKQLPTSSFDAHGSLRKDASSIAFLAFSGYNFIVSFLAIAALGGICVPLCK
jgi:malonyl-CoA/methylmalonyl-CoA synthetase